MTQPGSIKAIILRGPDYSLLQHPNGAQAEVDAQPGWALDLCLEILCGELPREPKRIKDSLNNLRWVKCRELVANEVLLWRSQHSIEFILLDSKLSIMGLQSRSKSTEKQHTIVEIAIILKSSLRLANIGLLGTSWKPVQFVVNRDDYYKWHAKMLPRMDVKSSNVGSCGDCWIAITEFVSWNSRGNIEHTTWRVPMRTSEQYFIYHAGAFFFIFRASVLFN